MTFQGRRFASSVEWKVCLVFTQGDSLSLERRATFFTLPGGRKKFAINERKTSATWFFIFLLIYLTLKNIMFGRWVCVFINAKVDCLHINPIFVEAPSHYFHAPFLWLKIPLLYYTGDESASNNSPNLFFSTCRGVKIIQVKRPSHSLLPESIKARTPHSSKWMKLEQKACYMCVRAYILM